MGRSTVLKEALQPASSKAGSDIHEQLLAYCTHVRSLRTPEAVLNDLHAITSSPGLKLNVLAAGRPPLNVGEWEKFSLGETVFLHGAVLKGWWDEWYRRAPSHNPAGYFLARMSLAPYTFSEMLRILEPIGADTWGMDLLMKYGIRDGFMCPIGGRWLVAFWSERVVTNVLTEPLRIEIFAASSFAAMRLEQLLEAGQQRAGAHARLTPRELAVVRLLSWGKSVKEVANHLGLGEETVRTHLKKLQAKLGVRGRTHAVAQAMRQHLIL
jgi:DNA-binding CsgD family transcriptional regulator